MSESKVVFRLLGPGTFSEEAKDFRDGYAIERIETTILGEFRSRDEARDFMRARQGGRDEAPR